MMCIDKILSFHRILASIWFVDPPFYDSSRPTRRYMMDRWGEYIPPSSTYFTTYYTCLPLTKGHILPHSPPCILLYTGLYRPKTCQERVQIIL